MSMLYNFFDILIVQSVKHIKRVCAIRFSYFGIIIWEEFHNLCMLSDERENIINTNCCDIKLLNEMINVTNYALKLKT